MVIGVIELVRVIDRELGKTAKMRATLTTPAQMELECVLGFVDILRELVRSTGMFLGLYGTSQTSQTKKAFFL